MNYTGRKLFVHIWKFMWKHVSHTSFEYEYIFCRCVTADRSESICPTAGIKYVYFILNKINGSFVYAEMLNTPV